MSYTAPNRLLLPARHSIDTLTDSWLHSYSGTVTSAWPSANLAIYVPLRIPSRVVVRRLWFGASSGASDVDMALYDTAGTAVIAATGAAHINTATEQTFDVTDTAVGPGLYYIALVCAGTDTIYGITPAAPMACAQGVLTQASAYPLPSTATYALNHTLAFIPLMGVLLGTVVT